MSRGRDLVSDMTGACYRVATHCVAKGGFGEVYKGVLVDRRGDPAREVAIKVSLDPLAWHGEAYFGRLLAKQPNVVPLRDSFSLSDGRGASRRAKYVLVFDWMDGTVEDELRRNDAWPERRVIREIGAVLRVLALLHRRGIVHRDITPRNTFVHRERLLLGDLGIARQGSSPTPSPWTRPRRRSSCRARSPGADGAPPTTCIRWDSSRSRCSRARWFRRRPPAGGTCDHST
jgi:serine/threonine protein kinase